MPEYTVTAVEDGISTTNNTLWDSTLASHSIVAGSTERAGFRFQGLPFESFGTDSQCPVRFGLMSLNVSMFATDVGTMSVYVVDEVDPAAFSNARVPGSGVFTEKLVYRAVPAVGFVFDDVVVPLDLGAAGSVYTKLGWQGNFALTVGWESPAGTLAIWAADGVGPPPVLETDDGIPLISGLDGPVHAMSRVDRCPKCIEISPRENWVKDGWTKRLVCPRCYDPDDPLRRRRRLPLEKPGLNDRG